MKEGLLPDEQRQFLELFLADAWVSEGGVIVSHNGFLSDRAREIRGWDDPRGHAFWELFDGEDAARAKAEYERWRAGDLSTLEISVASSKVHKPMASAQVRLIRHGDRELGVLFIPHAESAQERVRKLDAHVRVFQTYLREGRIGFFIYEEVAPLVARITHVNEEGASILERPASGILGMNALDLVHPSEHERDVDFYGQWREGKTDLPYLEAQAITGSGEVITVEAILGEVSWEGRPAGFVLFRDVTERTLILTELRRYAQAFELLRDTVVLADGDFNIIYVNPAGLERSGYSLDEVVGRFAGIFGAMREGEAPPQDIVETLMREGSWRGERWAARKDGTEYPVDIIVTVQKDRSGRPQMVTVMSRDISARKATEMLLRRARERAEFFTDLMSHDINNYIQGVLGRLELLGSSDLSEEQLVHVRQAMEQAQRTSDLVARVRAVSQAQHPRALEPVDLREVLSEALEDLRLKWKDRRLVVSASHTPEQALVRADDLLKDLIMNVVDNAIKHSPGDAVIDISTQAQREGDRRVWRLEVTDRGPGVPDAQKREVFYRFVRRGSSEGSGLGLSLVLALAERYNGRVWLEDREPGDHTKGTKVIIELPAE